MAKGLMLVFTNPIEGREDEFNDWYDNQHIPDLLAVPGFESAARFHRPEPGEGDPLGGLRYVTVYELEADTLQAPLDAVRAARDRGEIRTTDSIQRDPAPISLTFERS